MSTLIVVCLWAALGADIPTANAPGLGWHSDYGQALAETREMHRPLLVVLDEHGPLEATVHQAVHSKPADESDTLAAYTLCHVDVATAYGKRVAEAFHATEFPRTVIIDRTGSVQIFRKTGQMNSEELRATLVSYRNGQRRTSEVLRESFPAANQWEAANCFS